MVFGWLPNPTQSTGTFSAAFSMLWTTRHYGLYCCPYRNKNHPQNPHRDQIQFTHNTHWMSKLWPPRRYKKAWCPYLNHGIQANEVTRNKLVPRSVAIRWVFQYRHSYQLHGPTNCSVIPTEGTAETTSIGTMARRNFYHTAGFWNNNSNNNNFCARTVKEFLANFLT